MSDEKGSFSTRIFRVLLRLLPHDFRGDFGDEMEDVFRQQRKDAELEGGKIGIFRFWWRTIGGLLRVGPREHWQMLRQDSSFAFRMMRRQPGFTAIAVAVLALGIGANTAIFSMVHGVLLQPLPYSNGDDLVYLRQQAPKAGVESMGFSPKELADYRQGNQSFSDLVEYHVMSFILLGRSEPERVQVGVVSANYFDVFGVRPILGRAFRPDEEHPGADPVLILSNEYWMRSHGGDPGIIGRVFQMNDRPHTVVGVLPPLPQFPQTNDVYMPVPACPFRSSKNALENRSFRLMSVFGRLKPGVPVKQAGADLATIAERMEKAYPESYPATSGHAVKATPLLEELTQSARMTFLILLGTAGLVLLLACANVANLMLSRVLLRERELAVRSAMGASRGRLLRQMVTESTLLALAGGALALLFAWSGLDLLVQYAQRFTPRAAEIRLDGMVLAFTLFVSLLTGLIFGAIPALSIRRNLIPALAHAGGRSPAGVTRSRARALLVVAQVAVSFVLIIGAGLMVRSLINLARVDPGFNSDKVLTMQIALNFSKYRQPKDTAAFGKSVLREIRALPGVVSAAAAVRIPLQTLFPFASNLTIEGRPVPDGRPAPRVDNRIVSEDYFHTIGQPLLRGRFFTEHDRDEAPLVAVINQRMARHFWGNEDPLGRRISRNGGRSWFTIVGVVGDVRQHGLDADPSDEIYIPFAQSPGISNLLVRTSMDPMSIARGVREAIYRIDPDQPVFALQTLEEVRSESLAPKRLTTVLLGLFAAIAMVITAAGIMGVMALTVSQRTQEIGIRMALGASPHRVLAMVVAQGMWLVLVGLALGIAGSLAATRVMRGLLYGVGPTDPVTFLGVSAALAVCAAAACVFPARRAATIDPMRALRSD